MTRMRTKMCFDNDENKEKRGEDTMASDKTLVDGTLSDHNKENALQKVKKASGDREVSSNWPCRRY